MALRTLLSRLGMAITVAVLGLAGPTAAAEPVSTPPAETQPPAETTQPPSPSFEPEAKTTEKTGSVYDLTMTAVFGKPSYATGEKMSITVTVTNTDARPVTARMHFFSMEPNAIQVDYVNPFEIGTPFPLAGGESVTHTVTGAMGNPTLTTAMLHVWVSDVTGAAVPFSFLVPVVPTSAPVSGVVYYDKNRNRKFDAGEGQGSVVLTWTSQLHDQTTRTATTDKTGRFTIVDMPTGPYGVTGAGLGGLQVGWRQVIVDKAMDNVVFRGVAPVSGLVAELDFTKDVYAKDEAPTVRVTLTNTSDHMLSEIVATCNRADMYTSLDGRGEGWGALAGAGVDIAPHSTVVLDVTEPMPEAAYSHGYMDVGCEFRYPEVESNYNPRDYDRALVPGQRGDVEGIVLHRETGIAGMRVVLVPEDGCTVAAETTSGADGTFMFRQVPVGIYDAYLFPPQGWHLKYEGNPSRTDVVGDWMGRQYIELDPGDGPAPTLPVCRGSGSGGPTTTTVNTPVTPAPQGARAPALANTGASIAAPGSIGLLALLAGTSLVFLTRRRRATKES